VRDSCQVRPNPAFESNDPELVRELARKNPWATIVSAPEAGIVASHYPVMLDEEAEGLAILTHVGRPDEEIHDLGAAEVLCIVQGANGYISPRWYGVGEAQVPTWNFTVAHCYGVPELLDEEENLRVLGELVARFERKLPKPFDPDPDYAERLSRGTVGVRITVTRFTCKRKLSQNKDPATRRAVIAALREPGPYRQPQLASEMEDELGRGG
jgi:transcriptional regulator